MNFPPPLPRVYWRPLVIKVKQSTTKNGTTWGFTCDQVHLLYEAKITSTTGIWSQSPLRGWRFLFIMRSETNSMISFVVERKHSWLATITEEVFRTHSQGAANKSLKFCPQTFAPLQGSNFQGLFLSRRSDERNICWMCKDVMPFMVCLKTGLDHICIASSHADRSPHCLCLVRHVVCMYTFVLCATGKRNVPAQLQSWENCMSDL